MLELGILTSEFEKVDGNYYQVLSDQKEISPKIFSADAINESFTVDHNSVNRAATLHVCMNTTMDSSPSNSARARELFESLDKGETTRIDKLTDNFYFKITYMTQDTRTAHVDGPTTTTIPVSCFDAVALNTINAKEELGCVVGKLLRGSLKIPVISNYPIGIMRGSERGQFRVNILDIEIYQAKLNLEAFPIGMMGGFHIFPEKVWKTCYDFMHIDTHNPVNWSPNFPDEVDPRPFASRERSRVPRSIEGAPFNPGAQSLSVYLKDKVKISSLSNQGITLPTVTLNFVPKRVEFDVNVYVGGLFKLSASGINMVEAYLAKYEGTTPRSHEYPIIHNDPIPKSEDDERTDYIFPRRRKHHHHEPDPCPCRPDDKHHHHHHHHKIDPEKFKDYVWERCEEGDDFARVVVEDDFSPILFNPATMVHLKHPIKFISDITPGEFVRLVKKVVVDPTDEDETQTDDTTTPTDNPTTTDPSDNDDTGLDNDQTSNISDDDTYGNDDDF